MNYYNNLPITGDIIVNVKKIPNHHFEHISKSQDKRDKIKNDIKIFTVTKDSKHSNTTILGGSVVVYYEKYANNGIAYDLYKSHFINISILKRKYKFDKKTTKVITNLENSFIEFKNKKRDNINIEKEIAIDIAKRYYKEHGIKY